MVQPEGGLLAVVLLFVLTPAHSRGLHSLQPPRWPAFTIPAPPRRRARQHSSRSKDHSGRQHSPADATGAQQVQRHGNQPSAASCWPRHAAGTSIRHPNISPARTPAQQRPSTQTFSRDCMPALPSGPGFRLSLLGRAHIVKQVLVSVSCIMAALWDIRAQLTALQAKGHRPSAGA